MNPITPERFTELLKQSDTDTVRLWVPKANFCYDFNYQYKQNGIPYVYSYKQGIRAMIGDCFEKAPTLYEELDRFAGKLHSCDYPSSVLRTIINRYRPELESIPLESEGNEIQ